MKLILPAVIVLLILFVPRLLVLLSDKYRFFGLLGPVLLCYIGGIIVGVPLNALEADTSIAASFVNYTIPIAIPLILFSANFSSLKRLAKKTLLSFCLTCAAVLIVSALAFCIFKNILPEAAKLAGMTTGLYTGGTPNLYAIGSALHASDATIARAVAADTIAGGLYFLLLVSVMPRLARKFLGKAPLENAELEAGNENEYLHERQYFTIRAFLLRFPAIGLAVLCFGAAAGLALLITGDLDNQWVVAIVMLAVTTFGIALSFVKRVRFMRGTYDTGQYFIYMFSFAMGFTLDLKTLGAGILPLFLFVLFVQFGTVALHMLLSKLFKVDGDTCVITSVAGVFGPAFVTPVAGALKNRELIVPGLVCGILGYAVGNYLGWGLGALLM